MDDYWADEQVVEDQIATKFFHWCVLSLPRYLRYGEMPRETLFFFKVFNYNASAQVRYNAHALYRMCVITHLRFYYNGLLATCLRLSGLRFRS